MKIRSDFVTNSSSSSFILAFKSKEDVNNSLLNDDTQGELETLLDDILDEDNVKTKEEVLEYFKDRELWTIKFEIKEELEFQKHMSWYKVEEWVKENPQEFENMVNERVQHIVDKVEKDLEDKNFIVLVEYGDEWGQGDLEHHIVPYLSSCVARISHH